MDTSGVEDQLLFRQVRHLVHVPSTAENRSIPIYRKFVLIATGICSVGFLQILRQKSNGQATSNKATVLNDWWQTKALSKTALFVMRTREYQPVRGSVKGLKRTPIGLTIYLYLPASRKVYLHGRLPDLYAPCLLNMYYFQLPFPHYSSIHLTHPKASPQPPPQRYSPPPTSLPQPSVQQHTNTPPSPVRRCSSKQPPRRFGPKSSSCRRIPPNIARVSIRREWAPRDRV